MSKKLKWASRSKLINPWPISLGLIELMTTQEVFISHLIPHSTPGWQTDKPPLLFLDSILTAAQLVTDILEFPTDAKQATHWLLKWMSKLQKAGALKRYNTPMYA